MVQRVSSTNDHQEDEWYIDWSNFHDILRSNTSTLKESDNAKLAKYHLFEAGVTSVEQLSNSELEEKHHVSSFESKQIGYNFS